MINPWASIELLVACVIDFLAPVSRREHYHLVPTILNVDYLRLKLQLLKTISIIVLLFIEIYYVLALYILLDNAFSHVIEHVMSLLSLL